MLSRLAKAIGRFSNDDTGTAMVEFAIVAPVVMILAFGAADVGRAIQNHHAVEKSARDAARYLARVPATCSGGAGSITSAADIAAAKNLAMTGYVGGGAPILSYWTDPSTITVTVGCYDNSAGNLRGLPGIPIITVSIDVPYQEIGFLGLVGLGNLSLTGRHSEVHIGE